MKLSIILFNVCCYASLALMAQVTVEGSVTCGMFGIPGVVVSDGDSLAVTDETGHYSLCSAKRTGYVFISIPRGYEVPTTYKFKPQFFKLLKASPDILEQVDFKLNAVDNDNHVMVLGADSHLTNMRSDLELFRNCFVNKLKKIRKENSCPVYSMILGDLTWDYFWFSHQYDLKSFVTSCKQMGYPMPLFPVIGNHDNDPSVTGDDSADWVSTLPWRTYLSPTYYSFNIGKIHYVVLDDVVFTNEGTENPNKEKIVGTRAQYVSITEEQFQWMEKDLSYVDRDATIIVALHVPTWKVESKTTFNTLDLLPSGENARLGKLLKPFRQAHIVSGHQHVNVSGHPKAFPTVREHNIAAICGTWWDSSVYSPGHQVCTDGSPSGFSVWTINGDDIQWHFRSMEDNEDMQMRIYDMNTVKDYFATDEQALLFRGYFPKRQDFQSYKANSVLINVFAWENDWKIFVWENNVRRAVTHIPEEDPFHTLAYDIPYAVKSKGSLKHGSGNSPHFFLMQCRTADTPIKVQVMDSNGRVFESCISRPHPFNLDMEQKQIEETATGVNVVPSDSEGHDGNDAITYNLSGCPVNKSYKGIEVRKGKKYLIK